MYSAKRILPVLFLVVFETVSASAEQEKTYLTYRSQPQKILRSEFMQRLLALPEWKPFAEAFAKCCDQAIHEKLSDREKLERCFPKEVVDHIQQEIAGNPISVGKCVSDFMNHVEAILFDCYDDLDDEEIGDDLRDIAQFLCGKSEKLEIDFDGVLAFVVDVNPRPWLSCLQGFREGKDYKFLRNDPEGDFILEIDYEYGDKDVSFCCAGLEIAGEKGRYALVFADEDRIRKQYEEFKSAAPLKRITPEPLEELAFQEPFFLFLDRLWRENREKRNGTEAFAKIKTLKMSFRTESGSDMIRTEVETRDAEDAKALRDMLAGFVATVHFFRKSDAEQEKEPECFKTELKDRTLFIDIDLNRSDSWKRTAKCLKQATEAIDAKQAP